ncbi:hypothetical protein EXIGLDRAFT_724824 [Exidia glandulosa HHB12029]|uniref:Uncharacterized protein n=1 Tax=Exidia glandulosa HHB12029 TaxID=1314781 RepID=A0A165E9C9_EXIGL|nr:hypothetical protein EXIGLDRAFT_724824 [Exidia glandulosa HHB12029]
MADTHSEASSSRSPSPEAFRTESRHARMSTLSLATTTIDDLTLALSSFSSPPTPEPAPLACCCGRGDDCDATRSWNRVRAKLERGLTLSAEVGQALLQRHEAYVRKYNALDEQANDSSRMLIEARERAGALQQTNDGLVKRLDDLLKEYNEAEKRLGQALMSHEVSDSSNKALLQELDTARSVIDRLSAQNARSAGWDLKLGAAAQEIEDLKQELDAERHRNKVAESKAAAVHQRYAKLEADLHWARGELEHMRATRSEFSQDILNEARTRLRAMQQSPADEPVKPQEEVTQILESLVADNELLKKDTAELQNLLAEAREDSRAMRDELEEAKAANGTAVHTPTSSTWYHPSSGRITPSFRSHRHTESVASARSGAKSPGINPRGFRFGSPHMKPGTLDTEDLLVPSSPRISSSSGPDDASDASKNVTVEMDANAAAHGGSVDERPRSHRPLMLLTRSRGVQTDVPLQPITVTLPTPPVLGTSPRPSVRSDKKTTAASTPIDTHSETSSILDSNGSSHHRPAGSLGSAGASGTIAALVTQASALLQRLREADVPTLSARLKRQQLLAGGGAEHGAAGALAGIAAGFGLGGGNADRDRQARDVLGHLSRTTVERVIREAGRLDAGTGVVNEDVTASRREMRALLTLLKETFGEMGKMRADVNEIVLNPGGASKFAEDVMNANTAESNPAPSDSGPMRKPKPSAPSAGGGWIAPISKLFGGGGGGSSSGGSNEGRQESNASPAPLRPRTPAPRIVSKVGATVGASHATAHVGFSKSGTRGISAAATAWDEVHAGAIQPSLSSTSALGLTSSGSMAGSSARVLELFAGAPVARPADRDWVVLPRGAGPERDVGANATLRAKNRNRLSRNLDALSFDGPGGPDRPDTGEAQITRTLRGRGLSDSSIRSTYLNDADRTPEAAHQQPSGIGLMAGLSKRVQGFRHYYPYPAEPSTASSSPPLSSPVFSSTRTQSPMSTRLPPPAHGLGIGATVMPIPVSASARLLRGMADDAVARSSSMRDESVIERQMSRGKHT